MFTAAEFEWKQAYVSVSWSGLEVEVQNSGKEAVINLLGSRIKNAEKTMLNNLSDGVYSDGTGSAGKQIGGLQSLVADAGTGTVGGINSSTYSFWQNQIYDFSAQGVTASSTTIQTAMNTLWLSMKRNRDQPDMAVADNTYYRYYWESLQAIQRVTNSKLADAGFENLKFMSMDVVPDGGRSGSCPANHMYFVNSDYLFYQPHKDRNMVVLDPTRYSTNQDAAVRILGWAGNMTVSNRALQGVILA